VKRLLAATLGTISVSALTAYHARFISPYSPVLERISLTLPPRHEGLHGMTIGFLADSHVGPFFTPDDLARACNLLVAAKPDLFLLGGDYASESPRFIEPAIEVLGEMVRQAPLGGFAVMGNHDLSVSEARTTKALTSAGIPVLRNDSVSIDYGGDTLWIAGIDETLLGRPDPAAAFAQIPAGAAALALWHEPSFAEEVTPFGAFAQLSGHTHGGQIRLPRIGAVGLPADGKSHVFGFTDAAGMPVYTTRGAGVYRPPLRFRCPPEVTVVRLVSSEKTNQI
jgi:predicted MPP superfamily phosphohydrolase